MASERLQRRLERLLDQIDETEGNGYWESVHDLALGRKRRCNAAAALDARISGLSSGSALSVNFAKDWLGHKNIQNTTIYTKLSTGTRDARARKMFSSNRVV